MKYFFSFYPTKQSNAGGFTFLNLLKKILEKKENYLSEWKNSDLILLNSHHWINSIYKIIFLRIMGRKFILRIDGPLNTYRKSNHSYIEDLLIHSFAINIASGLIFQSKWSVLENFKYNRYLKNVPFEIIYNGGIILSDSNSNNFRENACLFVANSDNTFKGFNLYQDLAKKALATNELKDLKFYLAGNINSSLKDLINIKNFGFLNKDDLSKLMKGIKYYIHPSIYEACSNALIEAINHNMTPFVYDGSSNIEIVTDDKLKFRNIDNLIDNLKIARKLNNKYKYNFIKLDINKSAENYLSFFQRIADSKHRKITPLNILIFLFHLILYNVSLSYQKIKSLFT